MMSEKLKTIKELADEIGVSKQAVWQKIKKESSIDLRQFTSKKGNTVYVDVDGQKVIKSAFFNKTSTKKRQQKVFVDDDNVNNSVDGNPEGNEEILFLRNLVSELQSEKKDLHKLLDQQQRLALQDKKLLEEYKAENDSLKALKMPTEGSQAEQANSQPKEEVKALKFEIRTLQEELNKQKIHSQEEREKLKAELTTPKKWFQIWK